MYLEIQHHGDQVKLIYHSRPEADGPLLTWGEIVSRPTPGHGAIVRADLYTGRSNAATQCLSFTALQVCHRVEEIC